MNERCPYCSEGTVAERTVQRVHTTEAEHVFYPQRAMLCDHCGFGGVTHEQKAWNEVKQREAQAAPSGSGDR